MPTLPYLHFQGQCAAALAFYAQVFGGTNLQTLRYAEGPQAPPAWKSSTRILHGQVSIGDGTLMASDFPPGMAGDAQKGFSVMQSAPDVASARAIFDPLADGIAPPGIEGGVMHAHFTTGPGAPLMGSDTATGMANPSGSPTVFHAAAPPERAARIFAALAEGGTTIMPLAPTFWAPAFGMLRDTWGTSWMISVVPQT